MCANLCCVKFPVGVPNRAYQGTPTERSTGISEQRGSHWPNRMFFLLGYSGTRKLQYGQKISYHDLQSHQKSSLWLRSRLQSHLLRGTSSYTNKNKKLKLIEWIAYNKPHDFIGIRGSVADQNFVVRRMSCNKTKSDQQQYFVHTTSTVFSGSSHETQIIRHWAYLWQQHSTTS